MLFDGKMHALAQFERRHLSAKQVTKVPFSFCRWWSKLLETRLPG